MKKLLLLLAVLFIVGAAKNELQAQTTTSVSAPWIWGPSPFQDSLWAIDTTNWQVVRRLGPTLPSFTITGINGMATDPTTGITYVVMKVSSVSGRVLGTIDLMTGVCTQVGNLGDNFSSITFREDGQMFGLTGDGATVPETMYLIDKSNGSKTIATALGNGADGEVFCYNPNDNFFYHWSGNGTIVYEKIMSVAPYTVTNIPIIGTTSGETFGAMFNGNNKFIISNISSSFNRIYTTGVWGPAFGSNPDDLRGLVMLPYFNPSDDTICANESITITAGGHQLLTNLYVHWGDGNHDSVATVDGVLNTLNHTYSTPGAHTIYVESYNGFGGDTIYSYTVQVNNIPLVTISGFSTVCSGDSVTLTATSGGTSQWYMNGVMIAGATTNVYSTNQAGVYNMVKTNLNGCSDSAATGTTVIVSTNPTVALGPDTSGCGWFVLDAGNAGSSFMWSSGSTSQMDTIMATSTNSVMVTNPAGCMSMDTVTVTINTFPVVNVGPDTTVCGGITVDAGNAGSSFLWCNGATTPMITLNSSGTCFVTVTNVAGCSTNDTITVVVNPNPVVTLGPDVSACTMVIITADSSLIGGTFLWCTGGTGLNEVITNSSTCDLQYTDVNGCMGYDTINITIFGNPTVTASANPNSVCADDANVVLAGSPAGGTFTGSSVTGNQFDPSIGAGNYSIIYNYTDANGCSGADTVSVAVSACVGIEENTANSFGLYPNPSTGILNVNNVETGSTIEVFDVLGNVVASKQANAASVQLDLSGQANGVYFVRVSNGNSESVQRVVIQK